MAIATRIVALILAKFAAIKCHKNQKEEQRHV
jgi:hypothetical protein